MKLQVSELDGGILLIALQGKMDSAGVYTVEMDFIRHCSGSGKRILVDVSRVSYISSIGIPMLVNTAKVLMTQNGKMALLNPQKDVLNVLEMVGVSRIIPVFHDLKMAKKYLQE